MTGPVVLHPDFAALGATAEPGVVAVTAHSELFDLVNLIAFGGDAARPTHVPAELGRVGPVALWESTGAEDHLPFWNTNYDGDAYLYLVHGSVRVEFKETDSDVRYGHYLARTGDLFRLPRGVAHRTYSGDGRRRITLEVLPRNPFWDLMGHDAGAVDPSGRVGSFRFAGRPDVVEVTSGEGIARCPRAEFDRAIRALVAHELHLGHNEFDGGFTVHDLGGRVVLSVPGAREELPGTDVLAVFRGLLAADPSG